MSRSGAYALLAGFAVLLAVFAGVLSGDRNPSEVPSALIGRPLGPFALPKLEGRAKAVSADGLALADLTAGRITVVNVFASWCTECRLETEQLAALGQRGDIALAGIDYKDDPRAGAAFLAELGDPFGRIGLDRSGRTAIDWGVYGVPETFVIDGRGRVLVRFAGALTDEAVARMIDPVIRTAARNP